MGGRGIIQVLDADSACRRVHCLPLAIRRGSLQRCHPVAAMGIVGALCLRGIGRPIVFRRQTPAYPWRVHSVGVRGLYDQGCRSVAQEKLGGSMLILYVRNLLPTCTFIRRDADHTHVDLANRTMCPCQPFAPHRSGLPPLSCRVACSCLRRWQSKRQDECGLDSPN